MLEISLSLWEKKDIDCGGEGCLRLQMWRCLKDIRPQAVSGRDIDPSSPSIRTFLHTMVRGSVRVMINFVFEKSLSEFICELPTQLLQGGWVDASNASLMRLMQEMEVMQVVQVIQVIQLKTSASIIYELFKRTAKIFKRAKSVLTTSRMQDRGGGAGTTLILTTQSLTNIGQRLMVNLAGHQQFA